MPSRYEPGRGYRAEAPRYNFDTQQWLIWNHETEAWEPSVEVRWMECGEWLAINRVCTKLIGHGGEHGTRRRDDVDRSLIPNADDGSDGAGTDAALVDRRIGP